MGDPYKSISDARYNPSWVLEDADPVTYIEKVINGTTYRKTLTWSGTNLTAVSAWVDQT